MQPAASDEVAVQRQDVDSNPSTSFASNDSLTLQARTAIVEQRLLARNARVLQTLRALRERADARAAGVRRVLSPWSIGILLIAWGLWRQGRRRRALSSFSVSSDSLAVRRRTRFFSLASRPLRLLFSILLGPSTHLVLGKGMLRPLLWRGLLSLLANRRAGRRDSLDGSQRSAAQSPDGRALWSRGGWFELGCIPSEPGVASARWLLRVHLDGVVELSRTVWHEDRRSETSHSFACVRSVDGVIRLYIHDQANVARCCRLEDEWRLFVVGTQAQLLMLTSCSGDRMRILTRTPSPSPVHVRALLDQAQRMGYAVEQLQIHCP